MSEDQIRKPVAAVVYAGSLSIVCDDGTSWCWREGQWFLVAKPVPGTKAAVDAEKGRTE